MITTMITTISFWCHNILGWPVAKSEKLECKLWNANSLHTEMIPSYATRTGPDQLPVDVMLIAVPDGVFLCMVADVVQVLPIVE